MGSCSPLCVVTGSPPALWVDAGSLIEVHQTNTMYNSCIGARTHNGVAAAPRSVTSLSAAKMLAGNTATK